MTNEELVKRFFSGRAKGDEESYGFSIKPSVTGVTLSPTGHPAKLKRGNSALYSKTSQFPIATKISNNLFIVEPKYTICNSTSSKRAHADLALSVAEQMGVEFIFSPQADKTNFQPYMERKINTNLRTLSDRLKEKPVRMRFDLYPPHKPAYKKLLKDIHALHDGEILLGLPKNQVSLLDTDGTQALWAWLIKENPNKEDRELLRKTYTLSRLLAPSQKERADSFDIIPWEQMS